MYINVWIAVSTAAKDAIVESLRWDEEAQGSYTGPLRNRSRRLFEYMQDETSRRKLFATPTLQGTVYHLFSVDFVDDGETLRLVQDEIDYLVSQYPNQIAVLGAWRKDGSQVSGYSIPNYLWRFMPAKIGATSNADLQDINLLFGQSPRDFS